MIQHISSWIGEEKLVGDEYDGPDANLLKKQMRLVKRACCAGLMEQMVNVYAGPEDCYCYDKKVDCACFTHVNNSVPNRVSRLHLMALRLYFGATGHNWANKKQAMRMRETRIHWENTGDFVLKRNAALLFLKTEDWGERADDALKHLCNLMNFNVVQTEEEAPSHLFDDVPERSVAVNFGNLAVGSNQTRQQQDQQAQTQQPRSSAYNVAQAGIESEIQNFLMQPAAHFANCKCKCRICASRAHFYRINVNQLNSVLAEHKVRTAEKDKLVKQSDFSPMGDLLDAYWSRFAPNFPKLAKIASVLKHWTTTSTALERTFSLIGAQYNKRRNSIICETLENLHNSSRQNREFIEALKRTCDDLNIPYASISH